MHVITLLGQAPEPGALFNVYKIGVTVLLLVAWSFGAQWADRDADFVKTKREQWGMTVLFGGLIGFGVLLFVPWSGNTYFIGLAFFLLLSFGSLMTYVIHRNGRVVPERRVVTPGHFKRLLARDPGDDVAKIDRGQRIHLADHNGKTVGRPQDREEFDRYTIVQDFLFDIMWRRAAVAELLLKSDGVRVVYRIDGVASERSDVLTQEDAERLVPYLKMLAGLNPEEIRRPQEGVVRAALLADESGDAGRITVVTSGSRTGERVRLSIQQRTGQRRLDELGLAPQRLKTVREIIGKPTGMVLLSGLKGSGVTTTLYGMLREHDAFMQNIHLLQRKSLYDLDNITVVIHEGSPDEVSFARQLQSVLRREPDIVGVDECADRETAQIALRASESDRKIYMSLEAKSAADALSRLMGLAEDTKLVASGLQCVINQRLVRVLCPACRQSFKPDESLLRKANLPIDKIEHFHRPPTEPVFDRKGREISCQSCQGSGYVGRTGVFEVMPIDDSMRELIASGSPIKQIKSQARKNKMYYMQEEGLLKVIDGTTSLDEIIRGLRDSTK
jgi:type II secretory ATPase GspE/PulE/Tfp pilus assembly ATPase PilB-like protein